MKYFANDLNIGQAIRHVLEEKGVSQAEFARKLDNSPTYVARLLKKETVNTDTLETICQVLDYNFFDDYGYKNPLPPDLEEDWEESVGTPRRAMGFYLKHPHIGQCISDKMKERRVTQGDLGSHLGVSHQEVSRLLKSRSIDTGKLVIISKFLCCNFFSYFTGWYSNDLVYAANQVDFLLHEYVGGLEELGLGISPITQMVTDPELGDFREPLSCLIQLIRKLKEENDRLRAVITDQAH